MHKLKTIYEISTKTKPTSKPKPQRDPFNLKQYYHKPNPKRLSDNGTLDTLLHTVRTEMLDKDLYKQNKNDKPEKKG